MRPAKQRRRYWNGRIRCLRRQGLKTTFGIGAGGRVELTSRKRCKGCRAFARSMRSIARMTGRDVEIRFDICPSHA